jgi:hypothetical protein
MHQRRSARTLTRRQLLTAGGAVLAPAALLAWWRPWHSLTTPPNLKPTPQPPAATRTPERIALPTERPRPSAPLLPTGTPVAVPATLPRSASPTAPSAAGEAAGTLLYLSAVDGRRGIVAVNADGSNRRVLVPGLYDNLAVSPDGTRLAVVGAIPDGDGVNQVTIYDDNGRTLARYPVGFRFNGTPVWSSDGTSLLCSILVDHPSSGNPHWETWVFGAEGARQIAPPHPDSYIPKDWTPDSRIAMLTSEDPDRPREWTLWTTNATGGDLRQIYTGAFNPVGWNRDGTLLYALTYADPGDNDAPLVQLIEIERFTRDARYLASADAFARNLLGLPNAPGAYRFAFVQPSPDGAHFALGVARLAAPGSPAAPGELGAITVIFMRRNNQITGLAPLPPGSVRGPATWSPDGTRLALFLSATFDGDAQLCVLDTAGTLLSNLPAGRASIGLPPQLAWSRDSHRLSYTAPRGLTITIFDPPREPLIVPGGTYPAWRPPLQP